MKNLIQIFLGLFILLIGGGINAQSQEVDNPEVVLVEVSDWYLTEMEIDGENYPFEPNFVLPSVGIRIFGYSEESVETYEFGVLACTEDYSVIEIIDAEHFKVTQEYSSFAYDECYDRHFDPHYLESEEYSGKFVNEFWKVLPNTPPILFEYHIYEEENGDFTLVVTNEDGDKTYYGNQELSVSEYKKSLISVYPNPVNDELFYKDMSARSEIEIYDITGKQLLQKEVLSNEGSVDLSNLSSGVYFYKVVKEQRSIKTGKLIKN